MRVLVVDDAVVIRRLLTDILSEDPAIEVAGAAANGRIALAKLAQVNPDVVVLDVEMPEHGRPSRPSRRSAQTRPTLPVIMFSTLTERGAQTTLEALTLGATDYITKPANVGSVVAARQRVRDELIPAHQGAVSLGPGGAQTAWPRSARLRAGHRPESRGRRRGDRRHRIVHRRPERARGLDAADPGGLPGPDRHRAAHAPALHQVPGRPAGHPVRRPGAGSARGRRPDARHRLDRPGRLAHGGRARGRAGGHPHPPGAAGEQLPPGRRRALPVGGRGLRSAHARGGADRDGAGWPSRLRAGARGRRPRRGAGPGHLGRVGNAGLRGAGRARPSRAPARADRAGDRASGRPPFRRRGATRDDFSRRFRLRPDPGAPALGHRDRAGQGIPGRVASRRPGARRGLRLARAARGRAQGQADERSPPQGRGRDDDERDDLLSRRASVRRLAPADPSRAHRGPRGPAPALDLVRGLLDGSGTLTRSR